MRKYPEGYPPENAARKDDMIEIEYDFLIQCGGLYKFYVDPQTADKASIHTILTRAAEEFQWYETPLQYLDKKSYKLTASLFGVEYLSTLHKEYTRKLMSGYRGLMSETWPCKKRLTKKSKLY